MIDNIQEIDMNGKSEKEEFDFKVKKGDDKKKQEEKVEDKNNKDSDDDINVINISELSISKK